MIQQKTSEECEQTTEQQREVEKQLKHAQWEVQDVKAMKDAKIHELEAKLSHEEKATKRLKEDYKRKYVTPFLSVLVLVKLSGSLVLLWTASWLVSITTVPTRPCFMTPAIRQRQCTLPQGQDSLHWFCSLEDVRRSTPSSGS